MEPQNYQSSRKTPSAAAYEDYTDQSSMPRSFGPHLLLSILFLVLMFPHAAAYDPLDPTGNITFKWDVISWTADGYVVSVLLFLIIKQIELNFGVIAID